MQKEKSSHDNKFIDNVSATLIYSEIRAQRTRHIVGDGDEKQHYNLAQSHKNSKITIDNKVINWRNRDFLLTLRQKIKQT